jgi:hypothetical protein
MSRVTFAASPTGSGAGTITALDSLGQFSLKVRFPASFINAVPNNTERFLVAINKLRGGEAVRVGVQGRSTGEYRLWTNGSFLPAVTPPTVLKSNLPAGDVVLYAQLIVGTGTGQVFLFDADTGAVLTSATANIAAAATTGAGTGAVTLHNVAQASNYDGLAIYSAALSADARWQAPAAADANALEVWGFTEQTGTTATGLVSATAMTLTDNGWLSGGAWPASSGPSPAAIEYYRRFLSDL